MSSRNTNHHNVVARFKHEHAIPDSTAPKKHQPYVPANMEMREFTFRAMFIGLVMTAILGAANAYLGLKAGMTIAATYPAAVIGMALLRLMKGSLLEENIARTIGSIGESVAAGAVFTIPAFVIAGLWPGLTGRPVLEIGRADDDRWHPGDSVRDAAAARDGRGPRTAVSGIGGGFGDSQGRAAGAKAAKILFANMGFGAFMYLLGAVNVFNPNNTFHVNISASGQETAVADEHESQRGHDYHRRRYVFHRSRHQPRLSGRGLHHRTAAGRA